MKFDQQLLNYLLVPKIKFIRRNRLISTDEKILSFVNFFWCFIFYPYDVIIGQLFLLESQTYLLEEYKSIWQSDKLSSITSSSFTNVSRTYSDPGDGFAMMSKAFLEYFIISNSKKQQREYHVILLGNCVVHK